MKKMLLMLMIAALSPMAVLKAVDEPKNSTPTQTARMSDAEMKALQASQMKDVDMKALLIGTWKVNDETTYTFSSDGKWFVTDSQFPSNGDIPTFGWEITDGQLIQIREPMGARPYRILFLTEHECLIKIEHHGGGYMFWYR